ncbi:astacin, partial [Teladorsagia circumcincta]
MNPKTCQAVTIVTSLLLLLNGGLGLSDNGRTSLIRCMSQSFCCSEQLSALEASLNNHTSRRKRQASKTATLWANKKVFYYFDPSFGDPMKSLVKKALNYLSVRTCLTFVENAAAANRIRVFSGSGCYSNVGMIGGEQQLSLADGCNT